MVPAPSVMSIQSCFGGEASNQHLHQQHLSHPRLTLSNSQPFLSSPGFVDQNAEKVSRSLSKLTHNKNGSIDEGLENSPMLSFHERVTNSAHNKLIAKERSDQVHVIGTGVKIQVTYQITLLTCNNPPQENVDKNFRCYK